MELILMFANDIALIEHPDTHRTSRKIQIWQKLAGNSPKLNLTKKRRCSVPLGRMDQLQPPSTDGEWTSDRSRNRCLLLVKKMTPAAQIF